MQTRSASASAVEVKCSDEKMAGRSSGARAVQAWTNGCSGESGDAGQART